MGLDWIGLDWKGEVSKNMKTIQTTIKGIAPLLQHKFSDVQSAKLESKTKKQTGAQKEDNPEDCLYLVGNKVCQPAEHLLQAIIKRASNYKIGGKGKKTFKELANGCLNIVPEFLEHKNQNWVVDSRSVVIPTTRGRMIRKRPRFDEWELDFTIQILNDELPVEVVKSMLDDAGREGGLGDYRPRFGRFIVTKFETE